MSSIFHRLFRRAAPSLPWTSGPPTAASGHPRSTAPSVSADAGSSAAFDDAWAAACDFAAEGDFEGEIDSYEQAIALQPTRPEPYFKRANALRNIGRLEEALGDYDRAIERNPDYAHAYCNRGVVLQRLGRLEAAMESYDRAIALDGTDFMAHYNHALLSQECSRWDEALRSYDRALELNPQFADAQYNRSMAQLFLGDFESGWRGYEWRWVNAHRLGIGKARAFTGPAWRGEESIAGKHILLYSEAGLGDTLQFCRYAISCAQLGATVILEVQEALRELLSGLEGVAQVVGAGSPLPSFDFHCPLLSLPLAFNTTIDTIPYPTAYLQANPSKIARWRERLGERRQPRVGLVWSGNPNNPVDAHRSVHLSDWLARLPTGFEYFRLQTQVRESDRVVLDSASRIVSFDDSLLDFGNTAALCRLMDVVVTVDTSLAHLAGALGHKTWVLVPRTPDFRWMREREDSPWYSSVKLYRQTIADDWSSVFERVAADLRREFS
jgi:Tfp pilus assembly protein PilF